MSHDTHNKKETKEMDQTHVSFIYSFIPDIHISPLKETYSEVLSVQLEETCC